MGEKLTPEVQQFLQEPVFAHVATLMKDGSPQVTPVWVDTDGEHILFNTAEGRIKARNLERDERVALSIMDNNNPYRTLSVRGRVKDITTDGADEHIDKLAQKYLGQPTYPMRRPGEKRLKVVIEPEQIMAQGI